MRLMSRDYTGESLKLLLAFGFGACTSALTAIFVAQSVGAEKFGLYTLVLSVQGVVVLVSVLGINTALAKFIAEYRVKAPSNVPSIIRIGLRIAAISILIAITSYILLADLIGNGLYGDSRIAALIPFSAFAVITSSISQLAFGISQGFRLTNLLVFMQSSTPAVTLGLVVFFLPMMGMPGIFISMGISQSIISLVIGIRLYRNYIPRDYHSTSHPSSLIAGEMFSFSVPFFASNILFASICWGGYSILVLVTGPEAMGQFSVALGLYQLATLVPQSIVVPMIPLISERYLKAPVELGVIVERYQNIISRMFFPAVLGIALFSSPLIRILYGSSYALASVPAYLMISTSYMFTLSAIVGSVFIGAGKIRISFILIVIWCALFLAIDILLIPQWGANALAFSFFFSYIIYLAMSLILLDKKMKCRPIGTYFVSIVGIMCLILAFPFRYDSEISNILLTAIAWITCTTLMFFTRRWINRKLLYESI